MLRWPAKSIKNLPTSRLQRADLTSTALEQNYALSSDKIMET